MEAVKLIEESNLLHRKSFQNHLHTQLTTCQKDLAEASGEVMHRTINFEEKIDAVR